MDPEGRECGEELGRVEEVETVIKIHCMSKDFISIKKMSITDSTV